MDRISVFFGVFLLSLLLPGSAGAGFQPADGSKPYIIQCGVGQPDCVDDITKELQSKSCDELKKLKDQSDKEKSDVQGKPVDGNTLMPYLRQEVAGIGDKVGEQYKKKNCGQ